jgi:hypothetical protein
MNGRLGRISTCAATTLLLVLLSPFTPGMRAQAPEVLVPVHHSPEVLTGITVSHVCEGAELVFTTTKRSIPPLLNPCRSNGRSGGVRLVRQSRRPFVTLSDKDSTNHRLSPFVGRPHPPCMPQGYGISHA